MPIVYVTGSNRRLSPRIGKFDLISAIGHRMVQIENSSPIYVPFNYDIEKIAINEINTKNSPLSLLRLRSIKDDIYTYEIWDLNEIIYDRKDLLE